MALKSINRLRNIVEVTDQSAIHYDSEQNLTAEQQAQAQKNIAPTEFLVGQDDNVPGAFSSAQFTDDDNHGIAVFGINLVADPDSGISRKVNTRGAIGLAIESDYLSSEGDVQHEFYFGDNGSHRAFLGKLVQTHTATVTMVSGTGTISDASCSDFLRVGMRFYLTNVSGVTGTALTAGNAYGTGQYYWVKTVAGDTFTFSATKGGTAISSTFSSRTMTRGAGDLTVFYSPIVVVSTAYPSDGDWDLLVKSGVPGHQTLLRIDQTGPGSSNYMKAAIAWLDKLWFAGVDFPADGSNDFSIWHPGANVSLQCKLDGTSCMGYAPGAVHANANGVLLDLSGPVAIGRFPAGTVAAQATGVVANLPSAAAYAGVHALVTDASAWSAHGIVAGGGSVKTMVYSDGTNWVMY